MKELKYGKTETTESLDNNGSFVVRSRKYVDGQPAYPLENYYEIREKVTSPLQQAVVLAGLVKDLDTDTEIVEAAYRIEGYRQKDKNGYYYIVKCYRTKVFQA